MAEGIMFVVSFKITLRYIKTSRRSLKTTREQCPRKENVFLELKQKLNISADALIYWRLRILIYSLWLLLSELHGF